MRGTTAFICTLLVVAALVPAAQAGWKWRGTNEPDTNLDIDGDMMWLGADTVPVTSPDNEYKVYFNGFVHALIAGMYNPNVAATGSNVQPSPSYHFTAFLGVWKDCNQDGYIGATEYGLLEYRNEILTDKSICPVSSIPAPGAGIYPFNDGSWVREFIPVGDNPTLNDHKTNPTVILAPGSAVWMDFGRPSDPPGFSCPTTGALSLRNVGSMLNWLDCIDGYQVTQNLNAIQDQTGLPVGGWDHSDMRDSPAFLNVENPLWTALYGADGEGKTGLLGADRDDQDHRAPRAVKVWDCDAASPTPAPDGQVNPEGSVYEPVNETYNVATEGQCKTPTNDNGAPWPYLEGDYEPTSAFRGRDKTDNTFNFNPGNRKLLVQNTLGPNNPTDLGLGVDGTIDSTSGGTWRSNIGYTREPQSISRADFQPTGGIYVTFYANTGGTSGLTFPVGAQTFKEYGSESCSGLVTGTNNGWNCDVQAWYGRCSADSIQLERCNVLGAPYNMRDVDCYDGTLARGVPVHASLADLAATGPCDAPTDLVVLEQVPS